MELAEQTRARGIFLCRGLVTRRRGRRDKKEEKGQPRMPVEVELSYSSIVVLLL
jgi:hypothetical protein